MYKYAFNQNTFELRSNKIKINMIYLIKIKPPDELYDSS